MTKDSNKEDKMYRLYRLDELDKYEVSDNDTDVRGYKLVGGDGDRLGKINELIVDPELGKVRYLDVKLDADLVVVDDNRHILVPIGVATLDKDHEYIIIKSLNRANVKFYPVYRGEPITREYEQALRDSHRFTMLKNDVTASQSPKQESYSKTEQGSENTGGQRSGSETPSRDFFKDEGIEYLKNRQRAKGDFHEEGQNENPQYSQSEIEVLKKERDVARAERDMLKAQLEQARKGNKDDFYDHEDFDEQRFYGK